MFGFLKEEAEKLGSVGRFYRRIGKFRTRNESEKYQWKKFRDDLGMYPLKLTQWEEQQRRITAGEEVKIKMRKPREPMPPLCPQFRILPPVIEHHLWWLLHNCIAHMLIGLVPIKPFFQFHDWTSVKLNAGFEK